MKRPRSQKGDRGTVPAEDPSADRDGGNDDKNNVNEGDNIDDYDEENEEIDDDDDGGEDDEEEEDEDMESSEDEAQNLAELSDSEDDVGERNRIGNVPLEWYDGEDHIGYNIKGEKIIRKVQGDAVDDFLSRTDDPNRWRTVYDKLNDEKMVLSKEEMDIVHRIRQGKFPSRAFDPYEDYGVTYEPILESLHNETAPKRNFVPSKHEEMLVAKMVRAIRNGWIRKGEDEPPKPKTYLLWDNAESTKSLPQYHIPAPKMKLPGHAESYNPPAEYLPTEEEKAKWSMEAPEDRPYDFIPTKHSSLREVPGFDDLIKQRFERCLDLYLCPRARRRRLNIDPETLIPKLPKPNTLKPFPTECMVIYEGHEDRVRTISVSPDGQWLASGSDDKSVKIWETMTGRCIRTILFEEIIDAVAWNPNPDTPVLAIATEDHITLLHTGTGTKEQEDRVSEFLSAESEEENPKITWHSEKDGILKKMVIDVKKRMRSLVWHARGDYFASASQDSSALSVQIHRLSKTKTLVPFSKSKGYVQRVDFHPTKPFFFLATKRHVRVYNLTKQEMVKVLQCPARWISSISIHPQGDNLIVGSYDCRVCWYDMDLSHRPYKSLKYHDKAVRQVNMHRRYPLFASASDDGKLLIFHGKVFEDLLTNPLIVPVKILKAHDPVEGLGILDCIFHPTQPWIFSSGADKKIKLFC